MRSPRALLERSRTARVLALLAGLVLPQVLLFGSSLRGKTILLPLDILVDALQLPGEQDRTPQNSVLSDLVFTGPQARTFSAAELRAGRLPLWDPMSFAGAPFAGFGKYNPFELPFIAFPSPVTLAWMQLVKSIVAGVGAYLFFRRALGVLAPAALFGAGCLPLTGFFMLWQGYNLPFVTTWLPWMLLATWHVVRRPGGLGGPALSAFTACALLGGQMDVAGQVLLVCGIFALWSVLDRYAPSQAARAVRALAVLVAAWAIAFALAAPYWLPLIEYSRTGERMARREAGMEERPPAGPSILPQIVVPDFYGTTRKHSMYLGATGNPLESAASTYTGLIATLVAAPLAWSGRRNRRRAWFWLGLGVFALGWQLGLPGVVQLLRLPGLNAMSHNRFVFATSFAILVLAVIGLENLTDEFFAARRWVALPVMLLLPLGAICAVRGMESEVAFAARLAPFFSPGPVPPEVLRETHAAVTHACRWAVVLCSVALITLGVICVGHRPRQWCASLIGAAMVAELLVFGWDLNPQCDPGLYYPRIGVLDQLARAPAGRVLGVGCLLPNLHESYGLHEIRGYDGIDPKRLVELLAPARDPRTGPGPSYAILQNYVPTARLARDGALELPKILDLLDVRYLLLEGPPPAGTHPIFEGDGLFVLQNPNALDRVSVPHRVEVVPDQRQVLGLMAAPGFDPRDVAYVNGAVSVAPHAEGRARIVDEVPTRVRVEINMTTPGLLVLADQWYEGWHAYVNDRPAPVLRADYALRGVEVPAGSSTVVFRYEPESLVTGVRLLIAALILLTLWAWRSASARRPEAPPSGIVGSDA